MSFGASQMLWLLLLLIVPLIGFYWWAWRKRQQLMTQFISSRLLGQLKVGVSSSRQKARMALMVIIVALLILALARPQWGFTNEEVRQIGLDIVVAIDTSNSMLAEDVSPNRLARAKLAALDLVRKARTDRMGLVAFAGSAFLQCPLTLDDAAFSQSVDSLDTQTISQGGTALAQAIEEARKAFKNDSENHKVLVLFTDGEDHDGQAVESAKKAAEEGMNIFTIGIGTSEGEVLRIRDPRGRVETIKDEQGQEVKSHLNETLLNDIAHATKLGFYLPLRGTRTIDTLYEHGIGLLPKNEGTSRIFQRYRERFHWPLALAMALLIVEMFYPERKRRRSTSASSTTRSATASVEAVVVLLMLTLPLVAHAGGGASGALREYNQGHYEDSLRDYDRLLERRKDDPRLQFNAGAAAYQSRQMEEAAKRFSNSLASPDLQLQQHSYYNLGNTLYRLGEQLSSASEKQKNWEDSVKQFDSALKLNQQDADAKFNRDFVVKQIEELKKQQQQQQQPDKNDQKQDQDKKDQKDQNQSKNQQDQNSQSKQDQNQSQTNQNSQAQNQQQNKPDQKKQDSDQSQAKNDQKDQQDKKDNDPQKQGSGQPQEKSAEDAAREAAMMAAGQMTPTQAMQLLDAQKGEEQVLRLSPTNRPSGQGRSFKNW